MNIYNPNTLIEFAKKKKSNVRTCLNGANNATGASQTFDTAKVQINSEITKQKLENLKEKYKNVKIPYGFLTDLRSAMGLPPVKRASNYGIITIPKADGTSTVSIRISNHSTNAGTYITNNANQEYNLSIVVRKRARKKTFIPHDDVRLDEYIYYGNRLNSVESPLVQIINSIIGFLDSGVYVDTTGVALHNTSPQQPIQENNKQINKNKTIMKINESQLRKIIKESVKNVLKENVGNRFTGNQNGQMNNMQGDRITPLREYMQTIQTLSSNLNSNGHLFFDGRELDTIQSKLEECYSLFEKALSQAYGQQVN